jgi:hypothetical protein
MKGATETDSARHAVMTFPLTSNPRKRDQQQQQQPNAVTPNDEHTRRIFPCARPKSFARRLQWEQQQKPRVSDAILECKLRAVTRAHYNNPPLMLRLSTSRRAIKK